MSAEQLRQPCRDELLVQLAISLTDWKVVASFLGLDRIDIEEIEDEERGMKQKKISMLRKWKQKYGSTATHHSFARALWSADQIATVQTLVEHLVQTPCYNTGVNPKTTSQCPFDLPSADPACSNHGVQQEILTSLQEYSLYIRRVYQLYNPSAVLVWPYLPSYTYITLAMILEEKVNFRGISDDFVRMTIHGQVDDILHKKVPVELRNIFTLDKAQRKVILIEGAPGSGKSTLAMHICDEWQNGRLFTEFDLVVFVQLRDLHVQAAQKLADILPAQRSQEMADRVAAEIEAVDGKGVLFILDGWDELSPKLQRHSYFLTLIKESHKISLHESALVITSRPVSSGDLQPLASSRIEIVGFTPPQIKKYFATCLQNEASVKALLSSVRLNPLVESTCYLPLNAAIIIFLYCTGNNKLPETYHGLFTSLVFQCILRYVKKQSEQGIEYPLPSSLEELPTVLQQPFNQMCYVAFYGIKNDLYVFTTDNLKELGIPITLNHLGLMQDVKSFLRPSFHTYNFLHLSVQELLAAIFISHMSENQQVESFNDLFGHPRFITVFQYYAGLTKLKAAGLRPVLDRLLFSRQKGKSTRMGLLRCLYGAQDPILCCEFLSMYTRRTLHFIRVTDPVDFLAVGYFLTSVCLQTNGKFRLKLRRWSIDERAMKCLTNELAKCQPQPVSEGKLVHGCLFIDVCGSDIKGEGAIHVANLVKISPVTWKLNISENPIQEGEDGLLKLCVALDSPTSALVELNLSFCSLVVTKVNGPSFAEMVRLNTSLQLVYLSGNVGISDIGASYLAEGLKYNQALRVLKMEQTGLTFNGAKSLADALTVNHSLVRLHIGWNDIGDHGVKHIATALTHNTESCLKDLGLSCCGVTSVGIEAISLITRRLKVLYLSLNPIRNDGLTKLADMLKHGIQLSALHLCRVQATDEGLCAVADALTVNTSLQYLDVQQNELSDASLVLLGSALKKNQQLKRLNIYECLRGISDSSLMQFGMCLHDCNCIRNISLSKKYLNKLLATTTKINIARAQRKAPKLKIVLGGMHIKFS